MAGAQGAKCEDTYCEIPRMLLLDSLSQKIGYDQKEAGKIGMTM